MKQIVNIIKENKYYTPNEYSKIGGKGMLIVYITLSDVYIYTIHTQVLTILLGMDI